MKPFWVLEVFGFGTYHHLYRLRFRRPTGPSLWHNQESVYEQRFQRLER